MARIAAEIDAIANRKRKRREDAQKGFLGAVQALVTDLVLQWNAAPEVLIGVDLASNAFTGPGYYKEYGLNQRQFVAAFDGLRDLGYLEVCYPGNTYHGNTKVVGTKKLNDAVFGPSDDDAKKATLAEILVTTLPTSLDTLRLRDAKSADDKAGKILPWSHTDETRQWAANLQKINEVLLQHWADIELTLDQWKILRNQSAPEDLPDINLANRTLFRGFCRGNWESRGRFYGGWWQHVPRGLRPLITIDGKPTVEVDYSALHPQILYALEKQPLPEGDPYNLILGEANRDIAKTAFNALLNNAGKLGRAPRGFPRGCDWAEVRRKVLEVHAPIAKRLEADEGVKIQFKDSQLAEKVLLTFASYGVPCLPIHDSFIVHHGREADLQEAMSKAVTSLFGATIGTKVKPSAILQRPDAGMASTNLEQILRGDDQLSPYLERLSAWFSLKSSTPDGDKKIPHPSPKP